MSARRPFILFALSLAVTFAGYVQGAKADPIPSDRLLITNLATGAVLSDTTTSESAPGNLDQAFFLTTAQVFDGGIIERAVILTEPAGEPPGENSILVPGTNLIASDIVTFVISRVEVHAPWIFESHFFSDGDSNFEQFLPLYASFATLLEETGSLQDVTSLLHSDLVGWRVQVQSDVIPEPGTGLLVLTGMLGLAIWCRPPRYAWNSSGTRSVSRIVKIAPRYFRVETPVCGEGREACALGLQLGQKRLD